MNIYQIVDPKYWKLLSDKETKADVLELYRQHKGKKAIEQYLDNLNYF